MTDQNKKEICERILSKNNEELLGFFHFISSRIADQGLTEEREYRWDVAYKEILRRMEHSA